MRDDSVVRFSAVQRAEHVTVMVLFAVLSVTGLPQKFFEHVLIGLSVYAIITTQGDKIKSTRAAIASES